MLTAACHVHPAALGTGRQKRPRRLATGGGNRRARRRASKSRMSPRPPIHAASTGGPAPPRAPSRSRRGRPGAGPDPLRLDGCSRGDRLRPRSLSVDETALGGAPPPDRPYPISAQLGVRPCGGRSRVRPAAPARRGPRRRGAKPASVDLDVEVPLDHRPLAGDRGPKDTTLAHRQHGVQLEREALAGEDP